MKPTTPAIGTEATFVDTLTMCWTQARRSGAAGVDERLRTFLAERLHVDGRLVDALLTGLDTLGGYAVAELGDEDAIAEQEVALEASRRAVRPVFEARLQRRLARVDDSVALVRCAELDPFDRTGLQRRITRPADAVKRAPDVAYLEVDGVFVMTRKEDPDRRQPCPPRCHRRE